MRFREILGLTLVSGSTLLAQARPASACGGCFHPAATNMSTVVTGHRMAFAFSSTRTVLWDQIQFTGNPSDFSWVLPVKGDVLLEPAEDAWFESLEAVTNTVVSPPQLDCYFKKNSGGCDCAGGSLSDSPVSGLSAGSAATGPGVQVLHEGTVGPYDSVVLRASSSQSLLNWLPDNGYSIPSDIQPVIAAYQSEGFDFVALKLQPGQGTREMTPVRVITPGASPTLPLRMVAAGTGAFVGITLYVIAEGRYEASGFNNDVTVDFSQMTWDWSANTSNYADLRTKALAVGDGRNWLTSFAAKPGFTKKDYKDALGQPLSFATNSSSTGKPGGFTPITSGSTFNNLTDLYFAQASLNAGMLDVCTNSKYSEKLTGHQQVVDTCPAGSTTQSDAGASNGPSTCPPAPFGKLAASELVCNNFSDIATALTGMYTDDVWVTRLESNLPHAALAADLKVVPSASQTEVSNAHRASVHVNPPCDLASNHPDIQVSLKAVPASARTQQAGVSALATLGLLVARRASRRRARRS
jgi:hypothetical protein